MKRGFEESRLETLRGLKEMRESVGKKIESIDKKIEREMEREKAVKIIQKGCHNWLWKPICEDGTHGINVRLSNIEK